MHFTSLLYGHLLAAQCLLYSACNRKPFAAPPSEAGFRMGETWVPVRLQQYGIGRDTAYLLLHHDETAAAEAAHRFLQHRTGYVVQINNAGKRKLTFTSQGKAYTVDPNRIFTTTGILKQLKGDDAALPQVQAFANYLLKQIAGSKIVIALHNNTEGDFSVHSYNTGALRTDAAAVHTASGADADNFIFTTDARIFERCKAGGFHAVLQNNAAAVDDGSASVYFGKQGTTYLNIEAQHGHVAFTLQALQWLLAGRQ